MKPNQRAAKAYQNALAKGKTPEDAMSDALEAAAIDPAAHGRVYVTVGGVSLVAEWYDEEGGDMQILAPAGCDLSMILSAYAMEEIENQVIAAVNNDRDDAVEWADVRCEAL